jgi:F0F1-type ATP synthase assembly protein I
MIARDAEIRRLAARILVAQAASTIVIAAVYFAFWGKVHGLSALVGGLIGLTANAWMTLMTLRATPSAAGALGRLVFGQMVKVMMTVGLLLVVARGGWANWPALLIAYAATLLVFWFVPVLSTRPRRAKD